MTWRDWINSKYNTCPDHVKIVEGTTESYFSVNSSYFGGPSSGFCYLQGVTAGNSLASHVIIDGNHYTLTCFIKGTLITLVNGVTKPIEYITYDDDILVWDFDKGEFASAKPLWIQKRKKASQYNKLTFSDGSVLCTINQHRIFNVEAGKFTYPMTDETPIGTTTLNAQGEFVTLTNKEIQEGEKINFCVPTGNFGDILAGYLAKEMGLPINKLICASNDNKVLTDFFETKEYNRNREFIKTISPSMDILISSNLERLLYFVTKDDKLVANLMNDLDTKGFYQIPEQYHEKFNCFVGGYATENETMQNIKKVFDENGYLIDTHHYFGALI